jgi:hypothetical protein
MRGRFTQAAPCPKVPRTAGTPRNRAPPYPPCPPWYGSARRRTRRGPACPRCPSPGRARALPLKRPLLLSRHAGPPPRRNRAATGAIRASRGELRCPADREPQQVFPCVPSPLRKLPKPLYSFSPALTSPKQTPSRPPSLAAGELLARATTVPAKCLNRPPLVPRPLPSLSPAASAGKLTEFRQPAPASRP